MNEKTMGAIAAAIGVFMLSISSDAFAVDCDNPPSGLDPASAEINYRCSENDRHAADAKLNRVYKKLQSDIRRKQNAESDINDDLVAAQKSWIAFRDAECDLRTRIGGGAQQWSIVNHSECLTDLTDERTKVLQDYDKTIAEH
ncbi:lysozyme inhibitor LprI family protein [Burkholderia sp. Ac-20379]|uniref:lysozyme inhibitor LprI family protein n=1 Tax=Burkholderia sp. Ac-20379 TaxID=2703900 RepID=UPI00197FD561|nr:lysozyme inhibitor LprI family protein [Burkholderia sp. Ac-20379]MBN3727076.1 DUF1311 domain-containing protein [Burkholderia sp. Ac-20379]